MDWNDKEKKNKNPFIVIEMEEDIVSLFPLMDNTMKRIVPVDKHGEPLRCLNTHVCNLVLVYLF